jgi:DnaK suppressor protein
MTSKTRQASGNRSGSKTGKKPSRAAERKSVPSARKPKTTPKKVAKTAKATNPASAVSSSRAPRPKTPRKASAAKNAPAKKAPAVKKSAKPRAERGARTSARAERPKLSGETDNDVLTLRDAPRPYAIVEGETYMGPQQKEHFRRLLEAWRRELMEEVDRTVRYMQDEAANFPDANDRATQESEFSLELRTRDRERKLIRKIDEALTRIETDEYGYCVTCGEEIGIRRLEARPIATQCIDCKERDERRERQNRGL